MSANLLLDRFNADGHRRHLGTNVASVATGRGVWRGRFRTTLVNSARSRYLARTSVLWAAISGQVEAQKSSRFQVIQRHPWAGGGGRPRRWRTKGKPRRSARSPTLSVVIMVPGKKRRRSSRVGRGNTPPIRALPCHRLRHTNSM